MSTNDSTLIGVDWGTSRLRAFRIGREGRILERRASDRGVSAIPDGDFEAALRDIIAGWPSGAPILMCGMIGSRHGWREVPYRPCPASARDLAHALHPIETGCGAAWIVGGVSTMNSQRNSGERRAQMIYDVMRGEETQIIGAAPHAGQTVMITPGTHSKWAVVQAGLIESFRTYMTGEIFALLQKHSILGRLMQVGVESQFDEASFLDGVHLALEETPLLHSLFSVRTQGLFAQKTPAGLEHYLSGILIGSEVSAAARRHPVDCPVVVIAPTELTRLYQIALSACGLRHVRCVEAGVAVTQGLWKIWQLRGAGA